MAAPMIPLPKSIATSGEIERGLEKKQSCTARACFPALTGFLDRSRSTVDIWQVQSSTRMTRIKESSQSASNRQRSNHDHVKLIIFHLTCLLEINGENSLVHAICFIALGSFRLSTMTAVCVYAIQCLRRQKGFPNITDYVHLPVVEEQSVTRSSTRDEPMHGCRHVLSRRDGARVSSIISQDNHVLLQREIDRVRDKGQQRSGTYFYSHPCILPFAEGIVEHCVHH
jgi:hypothetical protein